MDAQRWYSPYLGLRRCRRSSVKLSSVGRRKHTPCVTAPSPQRASSRLQGRQTLAALQAFTLESWPA